MANLQGCLIKIRNTQKDVGIGKNRSQGHVELLQQVVEKSNFTKGVRQKA
jgi:hypothetical protein